MDEPYQYLSSFLDGEEESKLQTFLASDELQWCVEKFSIFGRETLAPRETLWFGDRGINYRYTGADHVAEGWPAPIQAARQIIQASVGHGFNFVIVNRYRSGEDYMGWHRDNERGCTGPIASLSLGAARTFKLATSEHDLHEIELEHNSLLLFNGALRHQLPKRKRIKEPRLNLTFRQISVS